MPYNISGIVTNSTDPIVFIQGVNDGLMQGLGISMFLLVVIALFIIGFYKGTGELKHALLAGFCIGFLLSIFLRAMDFIPNLAIFITALGFAISAAIAWGSS